MTTKQALKLIKELIDEYDGPVDAQGEPVKRPSWEKYDELVTEIDEICEKALEVVK